jgi:hypothetical protein
MDVPRQLTFMLFPLLHTSSSFAAVARLHRKCCIDGEGGCLALRRGFVRSPCNERRSMYTISGVLWLLTSSSDQWKDDDGHGYKGGAQWLRDWIASRSCRSFYICMRRVHARGCWLQVNAGLCWGKPWGGRYLSETLLTGQCPLHPHPLPSQTTSVIKQTHNTTQHTQPPYLPQPVSALQSLPRPAHPGESRPIPAWLLRRAPSPPRPYRLPCVARPEAKGALEPR